VRVNDSGSQAVRPGRALAAELTLGIAIGLEPQAGFADHGASGVVATRSSSWWNHRRCGVCGHTFRRGDRVLVDAAERTVRHHVPGLACYAEPGSIGVAVDPVMAAEDKSELTAGLLRTWPAGIGLSRIDEGDWRLPLPGKKSVPKCLFCGHTFRLGEYVVVCPCRTALGESAACGAAVHRDPAAGLPCWENWRPDGTLTVCPTTTARL
jgi:hypothetical protein